MKLITEVADDLQSLYNSFLLADRNDPGRFISSISWMCIIWKSNTIELNLNKI